MGEPVPSPILLHSTVDNLPLHQARSGRGHRSNRLGTGGT